MRPVPPVLALLMLASTAAAFASAPPGEDVHTRITEEAAKRAGWPARGVDALTKAVLEQDYDEMEWDPELDEPTGIRLKGSYDPSHHCDRLLPATHAEALENTLAYIRQERERAVAATDAAVLAEAAGQALHAVQDCFSHSDFVDLEPSAQERFLEALLGNGTPPPLRLVATSHDHDPPGRPPDPYPHDAFAKDLPDGNNESKSVRPDGRTKFEAARDGAVDASARFLAQVLAEASPEAVAGLEDLDGGWWEGIPAHSAGWALVLLTAAASRCKRRAGGSAP